MWERLKALLIRVMLAPVMPCFMWGPFVHPHIAWAALKKAEEHPDRVGLKKVMECAKKYEDIYVYAANSPDAISTNHVLRDIVIYDYAHNSIPDRPDGVPVFGYRMLNEALGKLGRSETTEEKCRYEQEVAFAAGWLSHQLADWIPHYQAIEYAGEPYKFYGYANSHQVIGCHFHPDILHEKETVEHALVEVLHDAYVYARDNSGYLSTGKNRVTLLIDHIDDHLVTGVSESLADDGYCRIPEGHLKSLERDFNAVIGGMESLIILLDRMQPHFGEMVTEFVEGRDRDYVGESVDYVFNNLFALSSEEVSRKAVLQQIENKGDMVVEIVRKKESLVQKVAFGLGQAIKPEGVDAVLREGPTIQVDLRGKLPCILKLFVEQLNFQTDLLARLKHFLIQVLRQTLDRSEESRALTRFASELISSGDDALRRARHAYCSGLRPIAQFDVDAVTLKAKTQEEILADMLRRRLIEIRFTPAIRTDKRSSQYMLDPKTVNIRVNGYSPGEKGAPFSITEPEDEDGILHYKIRLDEGFEPEIMHLFADIHDYRGKDYHSQYIDCQVRCKRSL